MAKLYAAGKTFHWRGWFKLKGFRWDPDDKEWVHQNLAKAEIYKIMAQCGGSGIRFKAISKNGTPLQLEDTTTKDNISKRPSSDHDTTSSESIDSSKFYSPGYSTTNAPKPYAKKFTDPSGNRED